MYNIFVYEPWLTDVLAMSSPEKIWVKILPKIYTYIHINTIRVWDDIIDREINLIRGWTKALKLQNKINT